MNQELSLSFDVGRRIQAVCDRASSHNEFEITEGIIYSEAREIGEKVGEVANPSIVGASTEIDPDYRNPFIRGFAEGVAERSFAPGGTVFVIDGRPAKTLEEVQNHVSSDINRAVAEKLAA